jgi:hypothetical protein
MKRKIVCLILLIMLSFTSSVFASNWVFYVRDDDGFIGTNWYIDADSVVKDGSKLFLWTGAVYDKPPSMVKQKVMAKYEASLSPPMQFRRLETHQYDSTNKELEWGKDTTPEKWQPVTEKDMKLEIDTALKYAKEGKDNGQLPSLPK